MKPTPPTVGTLLNEKLTQQAGQIERLKLTLAETEQALRDTTAKLANVSLRLAEAERLLQESREAAFQMGVLYHDKLVAAQTWKCAAKQWRALAGVINARKGRTPTSPMVDNLLRAVREMRTNDGENPTAPR